MSVLLGWFVVSVWIIGIAGVALGVFSDLHLLLLNAAVIAAGAVTLLLEMFGPVEPVERLSLERGLSDYIRALHGDAAAPNSNRRNDPNKEAPPTLPTSQYPQSSARSDSPLP